MDSSTSHTFHPTCISDMNANNNTKILNNTKSPIDDLYNYGIQDIHFARIIKKISKVKHNKYQTFVYDPEGCARLFSDGNVLLVLRGVKGVWYVHSDGAYYLDTTGTKVKSMVLEQLMQCLINDYQKRKQDIGTLPHSDSRLLSIKSQFANIIGHLHQQVNFDKIIGMTKILLAKPGYEKKLVEWKNTKSTEIMHWFKLSCDQEIVIDQPTETPTNQQSIPDGYDIEQLKSIIKEHYLIGQRKTYRRSIARVSNHLADILKERGVKRKPHSFSDKVIAAMKDMGVKVVQLFDEEYALGVKVRVDDSD